MAHDPIDRIAPTRRPDRRAVQRQRWHQLSFLHWRVPVSALRPIVPAVLDIDTFDGEAFIGIVPFTMTGVRPVWAPPVPGLSSFHETNVRTYVHRDGRDPGVWFFSLDAANRIAVWLARTVWHLPYHHARMALDVASDGTVVYASTRHAGGAALRARCRPISPPAPAIAGPLDHFLAERYLLYAVDRRGGLRCGQVHHRPYPLQTAAVADWSESLLAAARIERPPGEPLVHHASGVDVEIFALRSVPS